jgi:hypothetical protein
MFAERPSRHNPARDAAPRLTVLESARPPMEPRITIPRRSIAWWLAAVGLAAVLLVPLWGFPFFPTQDGPSHVANSWVLLSLVTGRNRELTDVYQLNLEPFPNWFSHASLAALLTTLGPRAAERVFLTIFVVALVASFRYALGSLRPDAAALAGLVAPFVYDSALHHGYYNRAFAAVPFLLSLGFWIRREGRFGIRGGTALAALLLWLYFCAAVTLVLAVLGLGVLLAAITAQEHRDAAPGRGRAFVHRGLVLAAACLPALLLLARFQARQAGGIVGPGPVWAERLRSLATLELLVSLDERERWLSAALALLITCLAIAVRFRSRAWSWRDAPLFLSVAATLVYLCVPVFGVGGTGPWGGTVHDRIAPSIWLSLLLWLGTQPLGRATRRIVVGLAIAIGLVFLGLRLPRYAALNDHLREYLSVAQWVPAGATVAPLSYAHGGLDEEGRPLADATWPFRHAADWLVPTRGVIDADNYEASVGYFPVIHRPGYDPYKLLGSSLDRLPGCVRLARFNRLAPRPADVVVVWNARFEEWDDPCTNELVKMLSSGYRRVYVSAPGARAEVYRRVAP